MAAEAGRSIREVAQEIIGHVEEIIRAEARLARAELRQEASAAAKAGVILLVGAVLGLYGLGFLLLALVYGLALLFASWWIGAIIVGGGLAILALPLIAVGRGRMSSITPLPERTLRSAKETLTWDKNRGK
ncbi:MAG: phage holin family protein [Steroidobacteraceae bacterium]